MAASTYFETVQKIYIAFYQRPADPGGLRFWSQQLDVANGNLSSIINSFANSAETQALYGAINASTIGNVIEAVYQAAFGRAADAGGKQFYTDGFNAGRFTPGDITLQILNGAQGVDGVTLQNKLQVAADFTRIVDGRAYTDPTFGQGTALAASYSSAADVTAARGYLAAVSSATASVPSPAQITTFVTNTIADAGDPIKTPTALSLVFTTGVDNLAGGAGADTFTADNTNPAARVLSAADAANGGDGVDTLRVFGDLTSVPQLSNLERVELDTSAGTANLALASGIQTVTASRAGADLALSVAAGVAVSLVNTTTTGNGVSVTYAAADKSATLGLNGLTVVAGDTLTVDGAGLTALTLNSTGAASTVQTLAITPAAVTTLNVTGSADLTIVNNDADVTTLNAATFTGKLTATAAAAASTLTGGTGADALTANGGNDVLNGGAGNDTFFGAAAGDTLAGGDGTDTLSSAAGVTDASFTKASSVEAVVTTGAGAASDITLGALAAAAGVVQATTKDTEASFVTLDAGYTLAATVATGDAADVVTFSLAAMGGHRINTAQANPATLDAPGANLEEIDTVQLNGLTAGQQVRLSFASGEIGNGAVNDSGNDQGLAVRVQVQDGAGVLSGMASRVDDEGVSFSTGAANLNVRDINTGANRGVFSSVVLGTVNADNIVGTADADYLNGGSGNDTLDGGAGNDFLVGGTGADQLIAGSGADSILGGSGDETLVFGAELGLSDSVDGGDGVDTLSLNNAGITALNALTLSEAMALNNRLSNLERLQITDALGQGLDLARADGLQTVILSGLNGSQTLSGLASGAVITQTAASALPLNALTLALTDASGAADSLSLNLANNASTNFAQVTVSGVESLTVTSSQPTANDAVQVFDLGLNATGLNSLTLSGTETLRLNGVTLNNLASVNASGMSANAAAATVAAVHVVTDAGAQALTGGGGADTLSAGAGNDTVAGGAGDDVITGGQGTDDLSGSTGNDTFAYTNVADAQVNGFNTNGLGGAVNAPVAGNTYASLEVIRDLAGADRIDLSALAPLAPVLNFSAAAGAVGDGQYRLVSGQFAGGAFTVGDGNVANGGDTDSLLIFDANSTVLTSDLNYVVLVGVNATEAAAVTLTANVLSNFGA